jgi:predicted AAA+ superfamily ATPase
MSSVCQLHLFRRNINRGGFREWIVYFGRIHKIYTRNIFNVIYNHVFIKRIDIKFFFCRFNTLSAKSFFPPT